MNEDTESSAQPGFFKLFKNVDILIVTGAVWVSTSAMALLEPCLPIWLMDTLQPEKWQLGIVFLPDSIGYLLGTNFFAVPALKWGRYRVAMIALLMVSIGCLLIPLSKSIWQLSVPHFLLGLGIGITDSALVPLLATLVEDAYGSVYAIAQTAVSLAYGLGPLIGGILSETIGFPAVLTTVGCINIAYIPLLYFLKRPSFINDDYEHVSVLLQV